MASITLKDRIWAKSLDDETLLALIEGCEDTVEHSDSEPLRDSAKHTLAVVMEELDARTKGTEND